MLSITGILLILLLCWGLSKDKKSINWQTILSGLLIQAGLAFFILKTTIGRNFFSFLSRCITALIDMAAKGGRFAFGPLYDSPDFIFAFKIAPAIIFISSLVSVLYFIGVMHPILKYSSWLLHKVMKVSGAEALANIASAFVGQVESALPLKPYFGKLTQSQFFAIMVGGMSTISAALLATYASMGIPSQYLLAANLMGIPAGLIIAKLLWPSENSENNQVLPEPETPKAANVMDAAVHGAQEGLKISLGVISMVIAFLSIIGLLDLFLDIFNTSLSQILGLVLSPFTVLMGVPPEESQLVGSLIGQKVALNEFVAFLDLLNKTNICPISQRSLMIASFAICGFANFGSIAIQLGAFSQMLPERRSEFAEMGVMAMFAGALASCLSACWANLFF
ncbi:MAG: nucleoside transporter C-terminal domain-containing protein [Candidatus Caenarcaniphilales bacterium]|nr:nucleoside transporter C-terminal domain-containing protein [Candidatus Caenarcaniphilales bacterium]